MTMFDLNRSDDLPEGRRLMAEKRTFDALVRQARVGVARNAFRRLLRNH
jgi:hypothetical protein